VPRIKDKRMPEVETKRVGKKKSLDSLLMLSSDAKVRD